MSDIRFTKVNVNYQLWDDFKVKVQDYLKQSKPMLDMVYDETNVELKSLV